MLTSHGVGFYSFIGYRVFGDTFRNVDEVTSPRFFVSNSMKVLKYLVCGLLVAVSAGCRNTARKTDGWHYVRADHAIDYYDRISDNYYKINGCKVALEYSLCYWPDAETPETRVMILLSFVDLAGSCEVPSFDTEACRRIPVVWGDGSESILIDGDPSSCTIGIAHPAAREFQQEFDRKKKCTMTATTDNGRKLACDFNITRVDTIDPETML